MLFFWKVPQSSVTQSHNLVSPSLQNHFCLSLCLSSQKLHMQKPNYFKTSNNSFPLPKEKSSPHLPLAPRQCCPFVLCSTFQLNYYFLVLKFLHRGIRLLCNYLTIKLIINKAQFSLVKTNLSHIKV